MFRLITSVILIGLGIAGFLMFTQPFYHEISELKGQAAAYDEALNNSKALENERDKLTKKYNAIDATNLDKLAKLLPDNVDNIRLILEIEKVAAPYGMILRDVKYNPVNESSMQNTSSTVAQTGITSSRESPDYGSWDLEFSTEGNYEDFNNFIKALESNLRIVDISSIDFSSRSGSGINLSSSEIYKYSFKIKTYWLKN
ncbi:hypothetical protein K8Q98_01700 [Candidatus Nomurabacteria bacterium]|nr:hypothetical protein [Candidatus Nomurabacteria bacterium]